MQFTRVVPLLTAMSLITLAAACSTGTTSTSARRAAAGTGAPSTTGTPATPPRVAPSVAPSSAAPSATPEAARKRVQAGRAPVAAGVDVEARRLRTERPGGRITGLSKDGVAVGVEGRFGLAPAERDAERAVRWDADRDDAATPLPAAAPAGGDPRIGPHGLIAVTTLRDPKNPVDLRRLTQETTAETADGERPGDDRVAGVIDVGTDSVLVARRDVPGRPDGTDSPSALWSPKDGRTTPVPIVGRFLTPQGTVVGDLVTGTDAAHPDGTAIATWRDGEVTELTVPRGWKGDPRAGSGDTVVGKLAQTNQTSGDDPPGQPAAAAVAWHDGDLEYLPPLGGRQSIAAAVNRRGTVVGTSRTPDPGGEPHAVQWRDGRVTDLGTLDGEGESWAVGVSDDDVAVGWSSTTGGGRHAVAWVRGGIVDLGAEVDPAATSQADGIVGRRVYGRVSGGDGTDSPVIWALKNH